MIFHNVYTMSCKTYSLLTETKKMKYLNKLKIWLPDFINRKAHKKFMVQFNEMFNEKNRKSIETQRNMQVMLFNKAFNLLPLMYKILLTKPNPEIVQDFKDKYGTEPKTMKDLEPLKNEMNQLQIKYHSLFPRDEQIEEEEEKEMTFEQIIMYVEMVLEIGFIDRNMKLYQFKNYFDKSLKNGRTTK